MKKIKSKQYVCTYNAITFIYDLENNKITYRYNDSSLTTVNIKNMYSSDFKDSNGNLTCPSLNCHRGSSGGDLTVTNELNVEVVDKSKHDNSNNNYDCLLTSKGSSSGEQQEVDSNGTSPNFPDGWDIDPTVKDCASILGPNLTKLVHFGVNTLKIVAAIIAIVNGMISFVPAIMSKDQDALKKAGKKCIYMAVVLALIFILPYIARLLGNIFDFDISCLV